MAMRFSVCAAAVGVGLCAAVSLGQGRENRLIDWGGGEIAARHEHGSADHDCVSAVDRARLETARVEFSKFVGPPVDRDARGGFPQYEFFPMAGRLDRDIQAGNWVDLQPGFGRLIWNCSALASEGHRGVDVELRSFDEQAIGVPAFAVADGVVSFAHDGEPDMNTQQMGQVSNLVAINHGGVRETLYYHLKNGSVSVGVGQVVRAGQQIGMAGSSGNSGGPHLHFESVDLPGNTVFEPWMGPCRLGESGWVHQPEYDQTLGLRDFGVTPVDLWAPGAPAWPFRAPAQGHLAFSEQPQWIWILVANMPTGSNWFIRWIRPNGTLDYQSDTFPFNNPEFYRRSWWTFNWYIFGMTDTPGTWRVQVYINGQQMSDAPIEVIATPDPNFNRPPGPITVDFEPEFPKASNVVFCRVNTSLTLDDPDFDVVRYTYEWRVNEVVVRTVTSAGHSDALARDTAMPGQTVSCGVTASDGVLSAAPVMASVEVAAALCPGDANYDRMVNFSDITAVLSNWLADYRPGVGPGDGNYDGAVNFVDVTAALSNWAAACP